MDCDPLWDDQWDRIKGFVLDGTKGSVAPAPISESFWMRCCGWRAQAGVGAIFRNGLVTIVGKRRYYCWIEMGVLDEMLLVLAREADLE